MLLRFFINHVYHDENDKSKKSSTSKKYSLAQPVETLKKKQNLQRHVGFLLLLIRTAIEYRLF